MIICNQCVYGETCSRTVKECRSHHGGEPQNTPIPHNGFYEYDLAYELSYIDLCELLATDLRSDECMPEDRRQEALATLHTLGEIIFPYSA